MILEFTGDANASGAAKQLRFLEMGQFGHNFSEVDGFVR